MKRVINLANQFSVGAQMWDDGLSGHDENLIDATDWESEVGVTINAWSLTPAAYRFANAEYKVHQCILSQWFAAFD